MLTNSCKKDNKNNNITVTDIDGNVYHTVTIGKQVWMVENLKTTKLNDGTAIPIDTNHIAWSNLTTPAYCNYNNTVNANIINTYGRLYNWYTVNTGKLCPTGWHVPDSAEWVTLINYIGGQSVAGGKMKETGTSHWNKPNTGADNSYGFTALPAGGRGHGSEALSYASLGFDAIFWSSTEVDAGNAYYYFMDFSDAYVSQNYYFKDGGFSVRCLKN